MGDGLSPLGYVETVGSGDVSVFSKLRMLLLKNSQKSVKHFLVLLNNLLVTVFPKSVKSTEFILILLVIQIVKSLKNFFGVSQVGTLGLNFLVRKIIRAIPPLDSETLFHFCN